jgi:hypothetical protein
MLSNPRNTPRRFEDDAKSDIPNAAKSASDGNSSSPMGLLVEYPDENKSETQAMKDDAAVKNLPKLSYLNRFPISAWEGWVYIAEIPAASAMAAPRIFSRRGPKDRQNAPSRRVNTAPTPSTIYGTSR